MTDGQGDEMIDPGRRVGRHRPGHSGPPIVTDHMGPLHAEVIEHSYDIADEPTQQ